MLPAISEPQFKDKFRVLALTRRGQGELGKPETGYDKAHLTEDLKQFLDDLKNQTRHIGRSFDGGKRTDAIRRAG